MEIHEQLKAKRLEKNWTLKQVADRAGLSRQRIHQIESGDNPTVDTVKKIAKAMDCKFDAYILPE